MKTEQFTMLSRSEHCWQCGGSGEVACEQTKQNPKGYTKCLACNGTGWGESIETYWKRNGITPKFTKHQA